MLRGVGAAMALPFLDVMAPLTAVERRTSLSRVRLGYLYFPNGVADGAWQPKKVSRRGRLLELNDWMKPLERFRRDLVIFENVWTPRGNGHGAGTATWLTGGSYDRRKIDAGGISVDQLAARHIGKETIVPSLELSLSGEGYFSNDLPRNTISWTRSDVPAPRETVPRTVFDRMFRRADEGLTDKSVLDTVLAHARSLRGKVSRGDRRKIDEYLDSVRSIERRLDFADSQAKRVKEDGALTDSLTRPQPGIPTDHGEYVRLMLDVMVLALWSGATRVSTLMLDHGQSNRYFNFIDGVKGTWHALSHYRDASGMTEDDDGMTSWKSVSSKRDMYNAVTRWHHEQVAYLLGRMDSIDDGDGRTLLDNSLILYGSSLADGHEHEAENLPLILAGRGERTVRSGRHVRFREQTTLSNLHLSMLQRAGVDVTEFGGSTGPMTEIDR